MEDGRVIHVTVQEEQRQSPSTQDCPRRKGGSGEGGHGEWVLTVMVPNGEVGRDEKVLELWNLAG